MDDRRFDELARNLASAGTSRRQTLKALAGSAVAGALAILGADRAAAQDVGAAACESNGARCGERNQPECGACCSGCTSRSRNGQRRCSCCARNKRCRRDDQCCSGLCQNNRCVDRASPAPAPRRLVERASGSTTQESEEGCQFTADGCKDTVKGGITSGSPIARGPFVGALFSRNFQQVGENGFTAETTGQVNLTEGGTANRLLLRLEGRTTGVSGGEFTFDGRYIITGGTGRFAGARGSGDATATGQDRPGMDPAPFSVTLTGSF